MRIVGYERLAIRNTGVKLERHTGGAHSLGLARPTEHSVTEMPLNVIVREPSARTQAFESLGNRTAIVPKRFSPKTHRVFAEEFRDSMMFQLKVSIAVRLNSPADKSA